MRTLARSQRRGMRTLARPQRRARERETRTLARPQSRPRERGMHTLARPQGRSRERGTRTCAPVKTGTPRETEACTLASQERRARGGRQRDARRTPSRRNCTRGAHAG
ncbi:MC041 [Molluscum contagiosum virus subtype 1]|nr:MC041 [Molluscum contagiosum virus subtype 1]DBA42667.1 TPA_asm: MC040.1L [Molluscum contagiosum virus]